jgi:hypothetical protein
MEDEVTASTPHQMYQGTVPVSADASEIVDVVIKASSAESFVRLVD